MVLDVACTSQSTFYMENGVGRLNSQVWGANVKLSPSEGLSINLRTVTLKLNKMVSSGHRSVQVTNHLVLLEVCRFSLGRFGMSIFLRPSRFGIICEILTVFDGSHVGFTVAPCRVAGRGGGRGEGQLIPRHVVHCRTFVIVFSIYAGSFANVRVLRLLVA